LAERRALYAISLIIPFAIFCAYVEARFRHFLAFSRSKLQGKGAEMNRNKHARHHGGAEEAPARLNWRRLHHTRLFWAGLILMLLAITIYVLSDDLAWRPRLRG
jgi:hypothetical protein